jgi:nickel/cobalt transporter (NicO) family protein
VSPMTENPLTWMYFPTALLLGALHALEPGHAKTLTAAYLIGIKGTKKDAFLLGLSVALTHSFVVIAISVLALWVGRESFTQDVTHWLQLGSGVIVVLLGAWLMVKRILIQRRHQHAHEHHHHHHHAPEAVQIHSKLTSGKIGIGDTLNGERFFYRADFVAQEISGFRILINRPEGLEVLRLVRHSEPNSYISETAPQEPHEFSAEFEIQQLENRHEVIPFAMHEPEHEHHDHSLMSDDEHARAHAAAMPEYAKKGERPTMWQIVTFGAAGGMIPCPASITVMLLALSIGKFGAGLFAVAGFSLGLAITLVGIGLTVVVGLSRLQGSGKFDWVSKNAPILSAGIVMLSGLAALIFAH